MLPIIDAMPTYFVPKAFSGHDKVAKWAVDWMTAHLDSEHYVFVEFKIPDGRQIDFLILTKTGNELQQAEAARAIIRLYSETLWTRKQDFGRKISRMQSLTHFVDQDEETPDWWTTTYRYFSDFLSAIPVSPVDQGHRAAVEFLKNELAFRSGDDDDEVTRALRILLSTHNPTEARRFPDAE